MSGHLSRLYDEATALLDTRNRVADGALDGASYDRKLSVLRRVRRLADQLEADHSALVDDHDMLANRASSDTGDGFWDSVGHWIDEASKWIGIFNFVKDYVLPLLGMAPIDQAPDTSASSMPYASCRIGEYPVQTYST